MERKGIDKILLFTCSFIESKIMRMKWRGWVWLEFDEGNKKKAQSRRCNRALRQAETINIHKNIEERKKERNLSEQINYEWRVSAKTTQRVAPANFSDVIFMFVGSTLVFLCRHRQIRRIFAPSPPTTRSLFKKQSFSINIILFLLTINVHMLQHTNWEISRRHQNSLQRSSTFFLSLLVWGCYKRKPAREGKRRKRRR